MIEQDKPVSANKDPGSKNEGVFRAAGLGLITGAADDDPSAIGTYASAGATFGFSFLWTAPVTFPMMFAVVYLSAKLGQVAGQGCSRCSGNITQSGCCTRRWLRF